MGDEDPLKGYEKLGPDVTPLCVGCGDVTWPHGVNCPYCDKPIGMCCTIAHEVEHRDNGDALISSAPIDEAESAPSLLQFPTESI